MAEMSPLRRRMVEDMTIRNLSPATQQSYIHAVSKFSRYFGHSPDRLGLEEVRAYQVHLISKGISWASLNQIVCALRFFYGVTLGYEAIPERIAYAREPRKLPAVLSAGEVVRFLEAVVFLDETWTKTSMTRLRGWAPKGKRLVDKVPHGRWKTATFLAALRNDRIEAPCLFDGPINGERFHAYVEQFLAPTLKPGDVVILDNLGSHKGKAVRRAIRDVGARLVFLPKYSPDLNPIE